MKISLGDRKEIQSWIRGKMPDMIRDLKRICRIRSVAETKEADQPPYGQGCIDVLEEMLAIVDQELMPEVDLGQAETT